METARCPAPRIQLAWILLLASIFPFTAAAQYADTAATRRLCDPASGPTAIVRGSAWRSAAARPWDSPRSG